MTETPPPPPPKLKCPKCGSEKLIGVEYRGTIYDYDGVSEWNCDACGTRWGRWTGTILEAGELEPRYGRRR